MSGGRSDDARSVLAARAAAFLTSAGEADDVTLISHVCGMPGAPRLVAERLAAALCGSDRAFRRGADGLWRMAESRAQHESLPAPSSARRADRAKAPASDSLEGLSYAVIDVETTGTRTRGGDRVTEVAAVIVRNGLVERSWETLVNPQRSIPPMITALTGITWEMVRDAPIFADICQELLGVIEGSVFVAHNAAFDWRFLSTEVRRATGRRLAGRRLCTVRLAHRLLPDLRSRRLDALAFYYGVEITARHRAGGDAHATARVLLRLLAAARDRECNCWGDLQALLVAPQPRPRRRSALPGPVRHDTTA